jgi:ABC-2 type transport system ATP-binding protein
MEGLRAPDRGTISVLGLDPRRDPADWHALMAALGLAGTSTTMFGKLSGGQKQRLSITLALVGSPQVAVLDELTTVLDPQARRDTCALIEGVRSRGVTIVLVTHFHGGSRAAV